MSINPFDIKCENCQASLFIKSVETGCGTTVIRVSAYNNNCISRSESYKGSVNIRTDLIDGNVQQHVEDFLAGIGKEKLGVAYPDCIPRLAQRVAEELNEQKK
jgi:hypothetical protein